MIDVQWAEQSGSNIHTYIYTTDPHACIWQQIQKVSTGLLDTLLMVGPQILAFGA